MIIMEINYESLTNEELVEVQRLCAKETERRKALKPSEEWANVVEALRTYAKKYGLVIESNDGNEVITSEERFDDIFYWEIGTISIL